MGGSAETGSGKTLAFGIPILVRVYEDKQKLERKREVVRMKESLKLKTMESKENRKKAIHYSDDDTTLEEESEFEEVSEEDVEEYLFNGPDGVIEMSYEDYMKETK